MHRDRSACSHTFGNGVTQLLKLNRLRFSCVLPLLCDLCKQNGKSGKTGKSDSIPLLARACTARGIAPVICDIGTHP